MPKGSLEWAHLAVIGIMTRSAVDAASGAGILCSFGALKGMTAGTLYEKRFGVAQHPVTSNLVQYAVGFAVILPLAWALEDMQVSWTGPMIAALLYLAIGNSLVSVTLLLSFCYRFGLLSYSWYLWHWPLRQSPSPPRCKLAICRGTR